jgi:hypothetical protein
MAEITKATLREYLNDSLPELEAIAVEKALRDQPAVQALFNQIRQEEDRGEHSVGAIWRRERLSCPSREQMGAFLLQALDPEHIDYIEFHLKTIACPYCIANVEDLRKLQQEASEPRAARRKRIIDSSAGVLRSVPKQPG